MSQSYHSSEAKQKETVLTNKIPVEVEQLVDPEKCYVCGQLATATCAHCKLPICEDHRQRTREIVTKITITLCDECADHYDIIKPQ